jgi:hypothetical protein
MIQYQCVAFTTTLWRVSTDRADIALLSGHCFKLRSRDPILVVKVSVSALFYSVGIIGTTGGLLVQIPLVLGRVCCYPLSVAFVSAPSPIGFRTSSTSLRRPAVDASRDYHNNPAV